MNNYITLELKMKFNSLNKQKEVFLKWLNPTK